MQSGSLRTAKEMASAMLKFFRVIVNIFWGENTGKKKIMMNRFKEVSNCGSEQMQSSKLNFSRFSTILVDPPRKGLDSRTLASCKRFSNVLYISCSASSLERDLSVLRETHDILSIAFFDHFLPHKSH